MEYSGALLAPDALKSWEKYQYLETNKLVLKIRIHH